MIDRPNHPDGFGEDELSPADLIRQQLEKLHMLSQQADRTICTIDDPAMITSGLPFTLTVVGIRPNKTIVGQPINTTSGVIHMMDAKNPIRLALNEAVKAAILGRMHPNPTSATEAGPSQS